MNDITDNGVNTFSFEGHAVRIIVIDGAPWFCASDVCKALGYSNVWDALAKHTSKEGVVKRDTPTTGGIQSMTYIDERNLYRLIMRSKLESAERFQDWVCGEVLPTIRRTGSYGTAPQLLPAPKGSYGDISTVYLLAAQSLITTCHVPPGRALAHAYAGIEKATGTDMTEMRSLIPAVELPEARTLNATAIGERLVPKTSPRTVNNLLSGLGFQEKVDGEWLLTDKAYGFGEMRPYEKNGHSGLQIQWGENVIPILQAACDAANQAGITQEAA